MRHIHIPGLSLAADAPLEPFCTSAVKCRLCKKEEAKYTCPKCNIRYCSLDCYRRRNHVNCTDNFYQNSVTDNIMAVKDGEKMKMQEILARDEANADLRGKDEEDWQRYEVSAKVQEAFNNLDINQLNTEEIWKLLPTEAKKKMSVTDELPSDFEIWKPWWTILVKEESKEEANFPKVTQLNTLRFRKLKNIDSRLFNFLPEIVFAYCWTCRYLNGDFRDAEFEMDRLDFFCSQCPYLSENPTVEFYSDCSYVVKTRIACFRSESFSGAMAKNYKLSYLQDSRFLAQILSDCTSICKSFYFIFCMFSDIETFFCRMDDQPLSRKAQFILAYMGQLAVEFEQNHRLMNLADVFLAEKEAVEQESQEFVRCIRNR